jgi:hypothetical protein
MVGKAASCGSSAPDSDLVCTTADGLGNYQLTVSPALQASSCGPYYIRISGGTYLDEATGQQVTLTSPLISYMGENAASVAATLDYQSLVSSSVNSGVNNTAAGNGGSTVVEDEGDGGPFVGGTAGTAPTDCAKPENSGAVQCVTDNKKGSFNANLVTTIALNSLINSGLPLNNANMNSSVKGVNTALGLPSNLNPSMSKHGNGSDTFSNVLFSLGQLAGDKGVSTIANSSPTSSAFQTDFQQALSQVPALPTRWIFASPSYSDGTRTALLATGEMALPGLGTLRIVKNGSATQLLMPSAGQKALSWSGIDHVFTLCSASNTYLGVVLAPTNDGLLRIEAGYSSLGVQESNNSINSGAALLGCAVNPSYPPNIRYPAGGNTNIVVGGGTIGSRVINSGQILAFSATTTSAQAPSIAAASLPAANYLLWVGGSANATNNYGTVYSPPAGNTVLTGNMMDTTTPIPVFQLDASGRVLAQGNSPISGNPYAAGFVAPGGINGAWASLLCERDSLGRLFGASAMLRVDPVLLSVPVLANQVFGRNWRAVNQCALESTASAPRTYNFSAAQGWQNTYAGSGTLSASQLDALLLPSSVGAAATNSSNPTDTVFYSAFMASGSGATAQLVMVERRITSDGATRDIRVFYTVP